MKRAACVYRSTGGRSRHVAEAMADGFRRHGLTVEMVTAPTGRQVDIVAGYGWNSRPIFNEYRNRGASYLYLDMGFFDRKPAGRPREGYHKVVLNGWCPTQTMRRGCPDDRFNALGVAVRPGATGKHVIVAGMSAKSARDHGLAPDEWETRAVNTLRAHTSRPIVYRPKPSWDGARPIKGAEYSSGAVPIADLLAGAHTLVTHHSNAAVDAIVAGVPVFCEQGVGALMSVPSMQDVEAVQPASEEARCALLADVAYCQWMPDEMRSGACWDHFKGLL